MGLRAVKRRTERRELTPSGGKFEGIRIATDALEKTAASSSGKGVAKPLLEGLLAETLAAVVEPTLEMSHINLVSGVFGFHGDPRVGQESLAAKDSLWPDNCWEIISHGAISRQSLRNQPLNGPKSNPIKDLAVLGSDRWW